MTKVVLYMGREIVVPNWVTHIATDDTGEVFGYDDEPQFLPSYSIYSGAWLPTGDNFVLLQQVHGSIIPSKTLEVV